MTDQAVWEEKFVARFVQKHRRPRYRSCLRDRKSRWSVLDRLNHAGDFIPERMSPLTGRDADPEAVEAILVAKGAGPMCWIMSSEKALDGKHCELREGVQLAVSADWGTVLICPPTLIAVYRPEASEQSLYLLA